MDPKNPSTVKTDNSFRREVFWKSTNPDQSHTQMVRGRTVWLDNEKIFPSGQTQPISGAIIPFSRPGMKKCNSLYIFWCEGSYCWLEVTVVTVTWWAGGAGLEKLSDCWEILVQAGERLGYSQPGSQAPPTQSYPCLNQSACLACSEALGSQDTDWRMTVPAGQGLLAPDTNLSQRKSEELPVHVIIISSGLRFISHLCQVKSWRNTH